MENGDYNDINNYGASQAAPIAGRANQAQGTVLSGVPAMTANGTMRQSGKSKSGNKMLPVVIILVILAVAGVCAGAAGWMMRSDKIAELEKKNEQLTAMLGEVENNDSVVAERLVFRNKEQIAAAGGKPLWLGIYSNVLNDTLSVALSIGTGETIEEQGETIGGEGAKVYLRATDYPYLDEETGEMGSISLENQEIAIDAAHVADVFVAGFGQAVGYETVFFLMDDGTVEYMPVLTAIKENLFESFGKLPGLTNIIKFMDGNVTYGMVGGGVDAFAQDAEGVLYPLSAYLWQTEDF